MRRRKIHGWGFEDETLSAEETASLEATAAGFGLDGYDEPIPVPRLDEIDLRAPRIVPPKSLAAICSTEKYERAYHSFGLSLTDSVQAFARDWSNPPDVVAFPENEDDVARILEWCGGADAAVVPFGGGTSVVNGVNPPPDGGYKAVVTVDMSRMDKVLEIDRTSRAARIQAGPSGLSLEAQLKPHGLTMRHYMQSFALSTLGGWIATRSGGHFATLFTHIDDMVESIRVVTPEGRLETRRLPGSGAGPSPDRMFIGSEGTLGIITEAWMRVHDRPTFRRGASVRFKSFYDGARAVRAVAQAGLYPANCRLIDNDEAKAAGASDGSESVLVLAFESADHPVDAWMVRALECASDHGGVYETDESPDAHRKGAAEKWRTHFIRSPFYREFFTARGVISETFETAITWDRFEAFHEAVMERTAQAIRDVTGRDGPLSCRFTHVYPDGPAPYFSFKALSSPERMIADFWAIKRAASDAVIDHGGTITHHHAVGRMHREWYDRQRPDLFAKAYLGAKHALDPQGLMNPGCLWDPQPK